MLAFCGFFEEQMTKKMIFGGKYKLSSGLVNDAQDSLLGRMYMFVGFSAIFVKSKT